MCAAAIGRGSNVRAELVDDELLKRTPVVAAEILLHLFPLALTLIADREGDLDVVLPRAVVKDLLRPEPLDRLVSPGLDVEAALAALKRGWLLGLFRAFNCLGGARRLERDWVGEL